MYTLYILGFFWGFIILFSLIGWGFVVGELIAPGKFGLGRMGAFGIALSTAVGGILNLIKQISPLSILVFLFSGLALAGVMFFWRRKEFKNTAKNFFASLKNNKLVLVAVIAIVIILLFRYALSVSFFGFHTGDDYYGYLAYPAKMIQTGTLGNDPFSERRITSSLGGQYFLDTFALVALDFKNLHLIDNGVGFLIFFLILIEFFSVLKLNKFTTLFFLLLACFIRSPAINITSFFTAASVFFVFLMLFLDPEKTPAESFILAPLLAAGVSVLKSNIIVPMSLFFIFFYWEVIKKSPDRKRAIVWSVSAIVLALVLVLPWMISLLQSSGTLFYPLLGKGYHGSSYGTFTNQYLEFNLYGFARVFSNLFIGSGMFFPLAVLTVYLFTFKSPSARKLLQITAGVWLGIVALVYAVGGFSLYYYSFTFLYPALLVILAYIIKEADNFWSKPVFLSFIIGAFIFGSFLQDLQSRLIVVKDGLSFDGGIKIGLMNTPLVTDKEMSQYKNLQNAVPAGEIILTRLDRNFYYDFRRNPVYLADTPGAASLPPGIPIAQGGEAMAKYLVSKSIKYVAYSYGAAEPVVELEGVRAHLNPWIIASINQTQEFQNNLMELSKTKKMIYDDGKNFVLDLSRKAK